MLANDIKIMQYYIIPEEIATQYQGFQKGSFAINFTQTNKDIWVINQNCGEEIFTEIDWGSFELIELTIEDFQPDYTPPTLLGVKLLIPEYWEMLFPEDKFIVGGYEASLERHNNSLLVDVAYLQWKPFRRELLKPENAALSRQMGAIMKYLETEAANNNFIIP